MSGVSNLSYLLRLWRDVIWRVSVSCAVCVVRRYLAVDVWCRGCFLEIHETVFVVAWVCGVCGAVSEGRKLLHSF